MATKIIENITTVISGEEIGSLSVRWDLKAYVKESYDISTEDRIVQNISSIEYQIFDKVGIDITATFAQNSRLIVRISELLLNAVETDSLYGLEESTKINSIIHHQQ